MNTTRRGFLASVAAMLMAPLDSIQAASSIHVQFVPDEMVFRYDEASVVPYRNSSAKSVTSPFVVLSTRT